MKEEVIAESPPRRAVTHSLSEWCQPMQDFLEVARTPGEAMEFLRNLIPELDSPFAGYVEACRELQRDTNAGETPLAMEPPDLLPVNVEATCVMMKDEDSILRRWVLTMVEVLNYYATMGRPRLGPSKLSPDQELMVTRLSRTVAAFLEKGGTLAPFKESRDLISSVRLAGSLHGGVGSGQGGPMLAQTG